MNHLGKIVLYLKKEKAFSVVENFVLWLKERKRERVLEQTDKKALTTDFRISKGKQKQCAYKKYLNRTHTDTPAQANVLGRGGIIYKQKTQTNKS